MSKMKFTKAQAKFFKELNRKSAYIGGLGSGKSFVGVLKAMALAAQGRVVIYVMPTQSMISDVAIPTLYSHISTFGITEDIDYRFIKSPKMNYYDLKSKGVILFRSAEMGERLRGINAHDAFFDEAGYIHRKIFNIVLGRLRNSEDAHIRIMTTPNGDDHWLYEEIIGYDDKPSEWSVFRQSTLANPFIPQSYKLDLIRTYTGQYARQELEGEFISKTDSEALIDTTLFDSFCKRDSYTNGAKILGVDIARFGDDCSAFALYEGNTFTYLHKQNGMKGNEILEHIIEICTNNSCKNVVVDCSGIGDGWIDLAKDKYPRINWIEFKGSNKSKKGFFNRRVDSWEDLRICVEETGSLNGIDRKTQLEVRKQLASAKKLYNNGKLQLLDKKTMRTKGIHSPDLADAMAMALNCVEDISLGDVSRRMYG